MVKPEADYAKFITNLANSIRSIGTPTPAKIGQLISDEINEATGLENVTVTLEMIDDNGDAAIDVGFNFGFYNVLDIPLDANFGLPGLGLQSQGSIEADFDYDANLNFTFHEKEKLSSSQTRTRPISVPISSPIFPIISA